MVVERKIEPVPHKKLEVQEAVERKLGIEAQEQQPIQPMKQEISQMTSTLEELDKERATATGINRLSRPKRGKDGSLNLMSYVQKREQNLLFRLKLLGIETGD